MLQLGETIAMVLGWVLLAIGSLLGLLATAALLWVMYRQSPLIAVLIATVVLPWLAYIHFTGN